MKRSISTSLIFIPLVAWAQPEVPDTSQMIHEIVVEAPKVIRKADMDVYHPSVSAVENSKSGLQLLRNCMIPGLMVNDVLGSITSGGSSVQVRINGRVSTIDEVRRLLPETIKRVEWINNPGLQYGDVQYVLNVIASNPEAGGSLMAQARPALNQAWGPYWADLKFNNGRSQWSIGGHVKLTEGLKIHRDYWEKFTYPDGFSVTRTETPIGGSLHNTQSGAWASYSYIKPDTTVFMASIDFTGSHTDKYAYTGRLSMSNSKDEIILDNAKGTPGNTPSLSLYLQQHLPNRQMIVVDLSGSLYMGRSFSDYKETDLTSGAVLTDIHTNIQDFNKNLGLEANYIKNWNNSRFTAGGSFSLHRNRSTYRNLNDAVYHQSQNKAYFFGEYFQRMGKFTATAGLGAQYNDYEFEETRQGKHSWNLRPQATLTYKPVSQHQFRLRFSSWQSNPTLAQTNPIPQQTDGFQWVVGNPDLKTCSSYMLALRYGFYFPRVSGEFHVSGFTSPDAIAPTINWSGDKLITTYENSRGLKQLKFTFAPQIEIVKNWLTAELSASYKMERMRGTDYDLSNYNWSGSGSMMLTHWGLTLSGQYELASHDLFGQTIGWGESLSIIDLSYDWDKWRFSAGMIMPFGEYDQGSKLLSKWNTNEQHMRLDMRMPYVSITYNLQWGKQKDGVNKLVQADSSSDRSSAGGR